MKCIDVQSAEKLVSDIITVLKEKRENCESSFAEIWQEIVAVYT